MLAFSQRYDALLDEWDKQSGSRSARSAAMSLSSGHTLFGRLSKVGHLAGSALVDSCIQASDKAQQKKRKKQDLPTWLAELTALDFATTPVVYRIFDDAENPNSISRFHFQVRARQDQGGGTSYELSTLGALNGVSINGQPVGDGAAWHPLAMGDRIRFAPESRNMMAYYRALETAAVVNLARSANGQSALAPLLPIEPLQAKDLRLELQLMPTPVAVSSRKRKVKAVEHNAAASAAAAAPVNVFKVTAEEEGDAAAAAAASGDNKRQKLDNLNELVDEWSCCMCSHLQVRSVLLACGHGACQRCMAIWFQTSRTCPVCRAEHKGCDPVINEQGEATIRSLVTRLDAPARIEHNKRLIAAAAADVEAARLVTRQNDMLHQAQVLAPQIEPARLAAFLAHHAKAL
jgi:hypothetical protein